MDLQNFLAYTIVVLLLVSLLYWVIIRRLGKRWTPARAAQIEGMLAAIARKVVYDSQATTGCSFEEKRDFKICFDYKEAPGGHFFKYDPVQRRITCFSGGLSQRFPEEVLITLRSAFPKATYYTERKWPMGSDPWHHLVGISESTLRRFINKK